MPPNLQARLGSDIYEAYRAILPAGRARTVGAPSPQGALPVGLTVRDGIGRGGVDPAPVIALKV